MNAADIFAQMRDSPIAPWALPRAIINSMSSPQLSHEPDLVYNARNLNIPIPVDDALKSFAGPLLDTPAARAKRAGPAQTMPHDYSDPQWGHIEQIVAQSYNNPSLARALARLRMFGEKSNSDQVNKRTGASTPYQISAETRQGIMKQHGFDPWANAENAVRGAAIAATTYTGAKANFDDPTVLAKAAGGYFGGAAGAANPFSGSSDGHETMKEYVSSVLGIPFQNPFDPKYSRMQMGELAAERKALLTPASMSINTGPAPEMPKPEDIPQTDFSASDQALQDMRPIEMSERDKMRRERQGYFKGIGQAMMNVSGNEGLGTFFLRLGGGALAGRAQAQDEIQREADKFDDKMSQFKAAVFSNDMNKARVHAQEAQAQVQSMNEYNLNNWKTKYERWLGNSSVDVSGTNFVVKQKNEDGTLNIRTVPIESAVDAAVAHSAGDVFQHMQGLDFAGRQQTTAMQNSLIGRAAIAAMSGPQSHEADAAAAAAPAFYGTFIAQNGLTGDLLGPTSAKDLETRVSQQLAAQQLVPGTKEYVDRHDRIVAVELAKIGLGSPEMMQKMMQVGGSANTFEALDAVQSRKVRTATDAKGIPTSSSTMNASDVFNDTQDNPWGNAALSQYGYSRY